MKKYLMILIIMFVAVLVACEPTNPDDGPLQCIPGYEEVDGKCELIIPECEDDDISFFKKLAEED